MSVKHCRRCAEGFITGLLLLTACSGDQALTSNTSPFLKHVTFTRHAYNLSASAPYDTAHLHVTTFLSDSSVSPVPVQYTVSDSTYLRVDASGVMRTHGSPPADGVSVLVTARVTYNDITRSDTVRVSVLSGPQPVGTRIAFGAHDINHGIPLTDSINRTWPETDYGRVGYWEVRDNAGTVLPGHFVAELRSGDSTIVVITQPTAGERTNIVPLSVRGIGKTWVYVAAYLSGAVRTDSVLITTGAPHLVEVQAQYGVAIAQGVARPFVQFIPATITIVPGTDVSWHAPPLDGSGHGNPVDIIFEGDSAKAAALPSRVPALFGVPLVTYDSAELIPRLWNGVGGSGDIAPFSDDSSELQLGLALTGDVVGLAETFLLNGHSEARRFDRKGTYKFHSSFQGPGGTIVVQ